MHDASGPLDGPGLGPKPPKLRVCVADDHLLMLHAIRDALMQADDIDVVGFTHFGAEILGLVEKLQPDLVLLDNRMPGVDGVTCLKEIKRRWPEIKVVMLSASEDPRDIAEALSAGAGAYIGKRIAPQDLASTLRQVVSGVIYFQSAHYEEPEAVEAVDDPGLTQRELTILASTARGLSTKLISRELWISEKTVSFHLTNIYRKLGVHNRTSAIRYAFEHDLLRDAPEHLRDALSA